jgi:hypothetical protein
MNDPTKMRRMLKAVEDALPGVLANIRTLADEMNEGTRDFRAVLSVIPNRSEYASARSGIELALLQCELVGAAMSGAPASKLQDLVRALERARKLAGKAG